MGFLLVSLSNVPKRGSPAKMTPSHRHLFALAQHAWQGSHAGSFAQLANCHPNRTLMTLVQT